MTVKKGKARAKVNAIEFLKALREIRMPSDDDDRRKTVNTDPTRNDARCPICGTRFEGSKGIPWGPLTGPHRFEGRSYRGHTFCFDTQRCADDAWKQRRGKPKKAVD